MSDTPTLSPDTTTAVSTSRQPWAEAAARKVVVAEVEPVEPLQAEVAQVQTTPVKIVAPKTAQVEALSAETTQSEVAPEVVAMKATEPAPEVVTPTATETPSRITSEAVAQTSSTRLPIATAPTSLPKAALTLEEMKRDEQVAGLVMKARLELRRGKKDDARKDIAQALALNPSDIGALELMGDVFLEEGEQEKAILVFKKGHAHHPQHAAFEEKIAIAQLDIEEMKIAEVMRQMAVGGKIPDDTTEFKPGRAAMLSLLVPGAGQFYLEQNERGAMYLGAAVLTLCGWALPLKSAMSGAGEAVRSTGSIMSAWSNAIASMSGGTRALFWLSMTLYSALYILSAWDAVTHIARMKEERKRALGL
jgi:tetratricopeptide (TPR) repeat protein